MIQFDRPGFFFLLPVVLTVLVLAGRFSLTGWPHRQALTAFVLRALMLLLVVLALTGPRLAGPSQEPAIVFLRDWSASISPEASQQAEEIFSKVARQRPADSAEVDFSDFPRVVRGFGENKVPPSAPEGRPATDLPAALEFAAAVLPSDRPGRIFLFSDGVGTTGRDVREMIPGLNERGIEVDVLPAPPDQRPEVAVAAVSVPEGIRQNEPFDLSASLVSTLAQPGTRVAVYQNELLVAEKELNLEAGRTELSFPNLRANDKMGLYEVAVFPAEDTRPENNRKRLAVAHRGPSRTLLIDGNPAQSAALEETLRQAGLETSLRPPAGFPKTLEDLQAFDLVIFAEVPAADLLPEQMQMLADWVKNFGGGFLMLGGENSFGAGGYFRTPLAPILPVRMERAERDETPVVALLVILDRSGSMSAMVGGRTKMALANEGAVLALDVLQNKDRFGLFAVDTRVRDVVPLGPVGDRERAARQITGITAGGGGIYIYTSLAEALPRLRDAEARIKHVILFSDAADAEEKASEGGQGSVIAGGSALDLAAAMLASRITLSVVALGTEEDRDTGFLRQLAAQGGGRFYLTADATSLPRLFTLETLRATESSLREDPLLAVPNGAQEVLRGIDWNEAPMLLGYNLSQLKPGANLLLATDQGEPLLAVWPYGLGQVGAFLSDAKARWAADWLAWPGFGKFWPQVVRSLSPPPGRDEFVVRLIESEPHLVLEAEAVTAEGKFRHGLPVTASVAATGQAPVNFPLAQVGPGLYRAEVARPEGDPALVAISDGSGPPVTLGWTAGYPAEFQPGANGTALLENLATSTGGKIRPAAEEVFRPATHAVPARNDLAPWLLLAAVLLWPVDVWVRRRLWEINRGKSLPQFSAAK